MQTFHASDVFYWDAWWPRCIAQHGPDPLGSFNGWFGDSKATGKVVPEYGENKVPHSECKPKHNSTFSKAGPQHIGGVE